MRRTLLSGLLALLLTAGCDDDSSVPLDGAPPSDGGADVATVDQAGGADQTAPDQALPDQALPDAPVVDAAQPGPDLTVGDAVPADLPQAPDAGTPDTVGWDILATTGTDFVVDRFELPTATTSTQLGVDFDNDGVVDNALGAILAAMASLGGMDVQGALDYAVYSGDLLQLLRLFAQSLSSDPAAVLQTWAATPQSCCTSTTTSACQTQAQATCFNGTHGFTPDPSNPQGAVLTGTIAAGSMSLSGSKMSIRMPLGVAGTIELTLLDPHMLGQVSSSGVTQGVVAGGIPQWDLQNKLIPAVALQLDHLLKDPLTDPLTRSTLQTLFDGNMDGTITAAEVANSTIIKTFLAGDVDVNNDGINELSVGLGFTAVPAVITP